MPALGPEESRVESVPDHSSEEDKSEMLRQAREVTEGEMVRKATKAGVGTAATATVLATFVYYAPSQSLALFVPY